MHSVESITNFEFWDFFFSFFFVVCVTNVEQWLIDFVIVAIASCLACMYTCVCKWVKCGYRAKRNPSFYDSVQHRMTAHIHMHTKQQMYRGFLQNACMCVCVCVCNATHIKKQLLNKKKYLGKFPFTASAFDSFYYISHSESNRLQCTFNITSFLSFYLLGASIRMQYNL